MTDFVTRLRILRESATPGPWETDGWDNASFMNTYGIVALNGKQKIAVACNCEDAPNATDQDWDLICLLVNNSAKIDRLIWEVKENHIEDACNCLPDRDDPVCAALAALNENADE